MWRMCITADTLCKFWSWLRLQVIAKSEGSRMHSHQAEATGSDRDIEAHNDARKRQPHLDGFAAHPQISLVLGNQQVAAKSHRCFCFHRYICVRVAIGAIGPGESKIRLPLTR